MSGQDTHHLRHALIIEPDTFSTAPYDGLKADKVTRVTDVSSALHFLTDNELDLVMMSTSFPPSESLRFLEGLRNASVVHLNRIVPIIVVVDLSRRISTVLGTSWGDQIGVICSQSTAEELTATLNRILN